MLPFVFVSTVLFAVGAIFGYTQVFPLMFDFFTGFDSEFVVSAWTMREVFALTTRLFLAFGVAFELPVLVFFLSISGIWGSSFLFISIGLDAFNPGLITWLRIGSGAALLWFVPGARTPIEREDRARVWVLSLIWVAIPFTLFPVAQQWIESAVAGMLNGAMPIFAGVSENRHGEPCTFMVAPSG